MNAQAREMRSILFRFEDTSSTVGGCLDEMCRCAAPTSLTEVPALASTLTRFRDQCSLRQQGVYIQYIYTTVFVSSHVVSYTRPKHIAVLFSSSPTADKMVTDASPPPAASHATGDKKPWRQTPLIESAKLSKEAGW